MQQTNEETIMVTLTFLIIAYAIRKRFLPEDATRGDKIMYYLANITMTPILGPWIYLFVASKSDSDSDETTSQGVFPYVG